MSFDIGGSGPTSDQTTTSGTGQAQVTSGKGQGVATGAIGVAAKSTYTEGGGFSLGKNARLTIVNSAPSTTDLVSAIQAAALNNQVPQVSDQPQSTVDWGKWFEYAALITGGLLLLFAIRKKLS